jgi:ketosteroid isomerase-like protein
MPEDPARRGHPTRPKDVVRALWDRMQERNWSGVRALLADELVVEWPVTAEVIDGPETFVRVNAEYPEGWSVRVLDVVADGDTAVSEVEVVQEGVGVFRAVSLWRVQGGVVVRGREYWTSPGSEEPPSWRAGTTRRA